MKPIIAGAACAVLAAVGCASGPPAAHVARQQRSTTEPERTIALGSDDSTTTTVPPAPTTTVEEATTVPPTTTATVRRTTPTTVPARPATQTPVVHDGTWAIPTYIVMCESGGRWDAYNPSGASGPYQIMPLHFGGELAMNQSRAAQHAKAAELWAGGAGRSHWAACL